MNYTIKVNDTVTLTLTAKEVDDLHDRLTTLYNDNYGQITNCTTTIMGRLLTVKINEK